MVVCQRYDTYTGASDCRGPFGAPSQGTFSRDSIPLLDQRTLQVAHDEIGIMKHLGGVSEAVKGSTI
jgi:hypothetical protein